MMENDDHAKVSNAPSMYPPSNGADPSSPYPPPYTNPGQAPPFTAPPSGQYPGQYPPYPAPAGQPYYPPQQYPTAPYAAPYPNGQQQQQVVVVGGQPMMPTSVVVNQPSAVSMTGAIALACVVYWCFGWLFGGIAYMLATAGQSSANAGDTRGAIRLRNASYGVSIAGIIIAVVVIGAVVGVYVSAYKYTKSYCYSYYYC